MALNHNFAKYPGSQSLSPETDEKLLEVIRVREIMSDPMEMNTALASLGKNLTRWLWREYLFEIGDLIPDEVGLSGLSFKEQHQDELGFIKENSYKIACGLIGKVKNTGLFIVDILQPLAAALAYRVSLKPGGLDHDLWDKTFNWACSTEAFISVGQLIAGPSDEEQLKLANQYKNDRFQVHSDLTNVMRSLLSDHYFKNTLAHDNEKFKEDFAYAQNVLADMWGVHNYWPEFMMSSLAVQSWSWWQADETLEDAILWAVPEMDQLMDKAVDYDTDDETSILRLLLEANFRKRVTEEVERKEYVRRSVEEGRRAGLEAAEALEKTRLAELAARTPEDIFYDALNSYDFDSIFAAAEENKVFIFQNIEDIASNFCEENEFEVTSATPDWLLNALVKAGAVMNASTVG